MVVCAEGGLTLGAGVMGAGVRSGVVRLWWMGTATKTGTGAEEGIGSGVCPHTMRLVSMLLQPARTTAHGAGDIGVRGGDRA